MLPLFFAYGSFLDYHFCCDVFLAASFLFLCLAAMRCCKMEADITSMDRDRLIRFAAKRIETNMMVVFTLAEVRFTADDMTMLERVALDSAISKVDSILRTNPRATYLECFRDLEAILTENRIGREIQFVTDHAEFDTSDRVVDLPPNPFNHIAFLRSLSAIQQAIRAATEAAIESNPGNFLTAAPAA